MSLRTRLLLTFGVLGLAIIGTSYATARTVRTQLIRQVDTQLDATDFARFDNDHPDGRPGHGPGSDGTGSDQSPGGFNTIYLGALVNGTIETLATPNASGVAYPEPSLDPSAIAAMTSKGGPSRHFTTGAAGDSGLRYRVEVRRDPGSDRVYIQGLPLDGVDRTISGIQRTAAWVGALTVAMLALAAWWLTRLGLRPIRQMTAAAGSIAAGSLSQRVPVGSPSTEAGQLGTALNGMLDRLESSFDERARTETRLRQFAADASHELRTPVQTIRGYGELYRLGALTDEARLSDAMRRTEQEATRMGRIIEDLLLLARLDQQRPLERQPVDLALLARDAVADAGAVQPTRSIRVSSSDPAAAVRIQGDEVRLRQVLGNLVGNALTHTPATSAVTVGVTTDGTDAVVSVADAGPGMDPASAAQAFERFYRSDTSRSRAQGGSGLGLSIVKGIIAEHGGRAELTSDPTAGTTVTIRLPIAPA